LGGSQAGELSATGALLEYSLPLGALLRKYFHTIGQDDRQDDNTDTSSRYSIVMLKHKAAQAVASKS
jgi:hypothetical protein